MQLLALATAGLHLHQPLSLNRPAAAPRAPPLHGAVSERAAPRTALPPLTADQPWPRSWVPMASTYELDPDRPTPLQFMGRSYVTWRDNDGAWQLFDDACPHRLAPLSEGRVARDSGTLECAYHGWCFESGGGCSRIPQVSDEVGARACAAPGASVGSYAVQVHKEILFFWPWSDDPEAAPEHATPEHMMSSVPELSSTYTRDLPYGWDTLVENLADPAHVPFAHHGMQGTRADAIAINMTVLSKGPEGFSFSYGDRTMGKRREGVGTFKAPYFLTYDGVFEPPPPPPPSTDGKPPKKQRKQKAGQMRTTFNLTTACIPLRAGHSRVIVFAGSRQKKPANASLFSKVLGALPVWLTHTLSGRFLDSDLAFLHYQEQTLRERGVAPADAPSAYFMPAPADRATAAFRQWLGAHAHVLGPLPPPITSREVLLSRWEQHAVHCVHCQAAAAGLVVWRRNAYVALAAALLLSRWWLARLGAVACLAVLRGCAAVEQQLKFADYKHYLNH